MNSENKKKPAEDAAEAGDGPEAEDSASAPDAPDAPESDDTAETAPDAESGAAAEETLEEEAEAAADAGAGDDVSAEPEEEDPEAKIADLNDKLLRALAETENMRRRAQRDKEDATKYAIASFAREMLSVGDNLKRAMGSVDPETRKNDAAVEQVMVGLEMTEREIQNIFERFGIKTIQALDEKFDHNLHEAMYEVDDASKPAGTVVQEVETGFMLNDRLLRPAKVGVSKGGPRDNTSENGNSENAPPAPDEAVLKDGQAAYEDKGEDPGVQLDEEL